MQVTIPWWRPGYLNGPHPLLLAYLSNAPRGIVSKEVGIANINISDLICQQRKEAITVYEALKAVNPLLPKSDVVDYLSGRNSLALSDLNSQKHEGLVFHHTTPYPFEAEYILHYENPLTLFYPFMWYGSVTRDFRLRSWRMFPVVKAVLEMPNCKLIFCHMQCFIDNLRQIFNSPIINEKLRLIRPHIPILREHIGNEVRTVMFSNSISSTDERFYLRGGLAAVLAFLNVQRQHPYLKMIILSRLPKNLPEPIRDAITSNSAIQVVEPGVGESEMNMLCANVDVLINASTGLHSMTILRAMSAGTLVITTDVPGNQEYVVNGKTGVVINGVAARVNFTDPESGLSQEMYSDIKQLNYDLAPHVQAVLLDVVQQPEVFSAIRNEAIDFVRTRFSADSNNSLWSVIAR